MGLTIFLIIRTNLREIRSLIILPKYLVMLMIEAINFNKLWFGLSINILNTIII